MSDGKIQKSKSRKKKEIIIVISAVLVVIVIATVYILGHFQKSKEEEKNKQLMDEYMTQYTEKQVEESDRIRQTMNTDIPGTYILGGEADMRDPSKAYSFMQIFPDGTVSAEAMDGTIVSGWWQSDKSEDEKFANIIPVVIGFPDDDEPKMYALFNDSLMEWNSVYFGTVSAAEKFDSEFVSASDTGTMTINIKSDGKANAQFIDTNEKSENKGLKYAFSGNYETDGKYITITLNNATTKFLMFDYNIEGSETDSGIAPLFYDRQKTDMGGE